MRRALAVAKLLWNLWRAFGRRLGRANTALLLALLFVTVLTPLGALMRLLGKDLTGDAARGSRWIARGAEHDMERQF